MMYRKTRFLVMACGISAMLLSVPMESQGCGFFGCLFGGGGQTTFRAPYRPATFAPAYNTSACTPCATQTCRYVPQTCYRTVYRRVPVTTCRAVTGCNPCTGCPVTTYRPVTTWACRRQLVPYTTYRLVYSNPCVPYAPYNPCGVSTSCPSGTFPSAGSGCSSCQTGTVGSPGVPYSEGATSAPTLESTPPSKTFKEETESPARELQPVPNSETRLKAAPSLIHPENRSTTRPVRQATHFRLIASPARPATVEVPSAPVNNGGWRASTD